MTEARKRTRLTAGASAASTVLGSVGGIDSVLDTVEQGLDGVQKDRSYHSQNSNEDRCQQCVLDKCNSSTSTSGGKADSRDWADDNSLCLGPDESCNNGDEVKHIRVSYGDPTAEASANSSVGTLQCEQTTVAPNELWQACVAQVMRVATSADALTPLFKARNNRISATHAVGFILGLVPIKLVAHCPLYCLVKGEKLQDGWQQHYPAAPDSLWAQLSLLCSILGVALNESAPYTQYLELLEEGTRSIFSE